ncbi:hypothetical protein CFIMG_004608RAa [Ceratocystis fimbriata CBS 114723]|uniref:MYND-type domain-containing protein n=1 Tax=Ceratocystis fimbriata CBS 114723 TaxID=1035309 RepID=A0A2C5WXQ9_9PEZI|nr:hypothetical protein CFIMG_004608RAa [Ceratocystis fimbriata CBS 114723]
MSQLPPLIYPNPPNATFGKKIDTAPLHVCQQCRRRPLILGTCPACQSVHYCKDDCRRTNRPTHRVFCSSLALSLDPAVMLSAPTSGLAGRHDRPFLMLMGRTYLHNRPAIDVYALLIDMFRLARHDRTWPWNQPEHTLPAILQDPQHVAKEMDVFLENAMLDRSGLLPDWWDAVHKAHCLRMGWDVRLNNHFSFLRQGSVTDIAEYYGHPMVPLQLRILMEQFEGAPFSDDKACDYLKMLVERESGETTTQYRNSLSQRLLLEWGKSDEDGEEGQDHNSKSETCGDNGYGVFRQFSECNGYGYDGRKWEEEPEWEKQANKTPEECKTMVPLC